jgi:hypothetical protein
MGIKAGRFRALHRALALNWGVVLGLAAWIWTHEGPRAALWFLVIWLVAEQAWKRAAGFLARREPIEPGPADEVPGGLAFLFALDVAVTLLLPWLVAGVFLGWY